MGFFVSAGMLVRDAWVGVLVCRAIDMDMGVKSRPMVMTMLGDHLFQAMGRIVCQCNRGTRREGAEPIKQRQRKRGFHPKAFGTACQHRALGQ
jgi:hypothetical protein